MPAKRARDDDAQHPDALAHLYAVEPEEFVAERKRLERELRDQGRSDDAAEIAGRKKPTLPVFAANRLALRRRADVGQLLDTAERLARAHESGDRDSLRDAQVELNERIRRLVADAEDAAGRPLSEAAEQRLATLLRAAAVDPDTAPLLRRGVLAEELEPAGFDALAGLSLAPPQPRQASARETARTRRDAERREKVERLERDLADARRALRDAEDELTAAERQAERARRRVAGLEDELDRARDTV
jgi:hypothetical protein